MKTNMMQTAALTALMAGVGIAHAQEAKTQTQEQVKAQTQTQERIYGSQLMTQQERNTYRQKMQTAKTQEEREQIRLEHHKQMQERAKAKGVSLPDEPPMHGPGMGPGGGMPPGSGMGPGGGMGPRGGGGGGGR